jgi:hypothetical protein
MKWELLNATPAIYWNSKHGLWLVDVGDRLQLLQMPHASVGDVLNVLRSIASLTQQEPDKKHAAAAQARR